jgi:hypothetical protein
MSGKITSIWWGYGEGGYTYYRSASPIAPGQLGSIKNSDSSLSILLFPAGYSGHGDISSSAVGCGKMITSGHTPGVGGIAILSEDCPDTAKDLIEASGVKLVVESPIYIEGVTIVAMGSFFTLAPNLLRVKCSNKKKARKLAEKYYGNFREIDRRGLWEIIFPDAEKFGWSAPDCADDQESFKFRTSDGVVRHAWCGNAHQLPSIARYKEDNPE